MVSYSVAMLLSRILRLNRQLCDIFDFEKSKFACLYSAYGIDYEK